jgi:predicted transcriptional regulator
MKTLAIRLEDDTHAQLSMLAQLEELTVTDAIRQAIDSYIAAKRSQPELTARAEAVLADIDRDAATRRDAIASLFTGDGPTLQAVEPTKAKPPTRTRSKRGDATS